MYPTSKIGLWAYYSLLSIFRTACYFKHATLIAYITDIFPWQQGPQRRTAYLNIRAHFRALCSMNDSICKEELMACMCG